MPRDRKGRFTAERTTTETTTTVTERLTVDDAPVTHPPPLAAGRPLRLYGFDRLLTSPPEDARWAHPKFIKEEAARAAALPPADHTNPYPDRPRRPEPVVVFVPRTYPQLETATLDAAPLEPLPGMMP